MTTRTTRKASQKGSTHHDHTTSKEKEKTTKATQAIAVDPKEAATAEDEAKEKDQKVNHPTTTFHHYQHRTNAKDKQKEKAKEPSCVTFVARRHTSDKCWWKGQTYNIDQSPPVWSIPRDDQSQQLQQLPLQSSASTTIMTQPHQ
eukprot:6319505-Amphidinium_carterae.1